MRKIYFLLLLIPLLILGACSDEKGGGNGGIDSVDRGAFVLNEGQYGKDNASISLYDMNTKEVTNDLFEKMTGAALGDIAQSMAIIDKMALVAITNSSMIQVFDPYELKHKKAIALKHGPRYMVAASKNKIYITNQNAPIITVLNRSTLDVAKEIDLSKFDKTADVYGLEQIVVYGKYAYTCHYISGTKVIKIDIDKDEVVDVIEVGDQPKELLIDKKGNLWVLGEGGYDENYEMISNPTLSCVDLKKFALKKQFKFPLKEYPTKLTVNKAKDALYFINNGIYGQPNLEYGVYMMSIDAEALPKSIIRKGDKTFYALGIDPITSEIYIGDAVDYVDEGKVYRYKQEQANYVLVDEFNVGVAPSSIYFR